MRLAGAVPCPGFFCVPRDELRTEMNFGPDTPQIGVNFKNQKAERSNLRFAGASGGSSSVERTCEGSKLLPFTLPAAGQLAAPQVPPPQAARVVI
jgi:hypothetical protein